MTAPASAIEVRPVRTAKEREVFLRVPWTLGLHREKQWVPPLLDDYRKSLDPKRSAFLSHGELEAWVAFEGPTPVGRICAHVDFLYDKHWPGEPATAFFGFFDSVDRLEVARALFSVAEGWARGKGRVRLLGPMTLDTKGEVGVLIEGFEHSPNIGTTWNRPYVAPLIEKAGYQKAKDLLGWKYIAGTPIEPLTKKIADRTRALPNVNIRLMDEKHLDREAKILQDVYNEAWKSNWGFTPFTDQEISAIATEYKIFFDKEVAYVAEVDGQPAAVLFAIPDVNEVIRDFDGELLRRPWNLLRLLYRLRFARPKAARLILLGVREQYRTSRKYGALVACLYEEISIRGTRRGYTHGDLGWTLEDNDLINKGIERMGATVNKKWRVFQRML